jgi:MoxR-like ATPase
LLFSKFSLIDKDIVDIVEKILINHETKSLFIVIPSNITKENIVSAIMEIERKGYPSIREPTKFYILYNKKNYPAKYALSISNKFANGKESTEFSGGEETNQFLKSRGFEIVTDEEANLSLPDKYIDLEKLILSYDKNKEILGKRKITENEAMKLRAQFVLDFPADNILDIEIDNYVQGKRPPDADEPNRKTFCYRLEFGLPGFGNIGGGNAIKFGIYYSSKEKKYVYKENRFSSAEEAYKEILTQINMLLKGGKQFTEDNDWKKLSDVFKKVDGIKSAVKSIILTVYYPDKIVSINSENGGKEILKSIFHIPEEEIKDEFILKKAKLWELKENHPIMKNWSNFDYSYFVWYAWKNSLNPHNVPQKPINNNAIQTKFWVVRAGGKGKQEDGTLGNNIVTIHWHELSDLSNFKDKDNLKSYYRKMIPNENDDQVGQGVGQVWSFLNEIKKNDIVILPLISKHTKTVAIGVILGDYEYREITPDIKHIRSVKWLHKEIPIDEFSDVTKKSLYPPRTVYQIQNQESLDSIIEVMKKYNIFDGFVKVNLIEDKNVKQRQELITTLKELSQTTYLSEEKLKNIQQLLEEKKQTIFYGPPGTSKTYVAKKFSEYFVNGKKENLQIIQFHPSYSYEDFIEGIKPTLSSEGEVSGFTKQPGIFKNLVDKCIKNPDEIFVLIIDEINRGNISKIFGELVYLLEYRNERIYLTYSPNEEFYIPDNLYIIGTMNSADRSIAFVDYALRRRFYFIEFYSDEVIEDVLKKWFMKNRIKEYYQNNVIEMLREINSIISKKLGREYQVGYSYFMSNLDYEKVKRIIDYAILPLIEQYFFGYGNDNSGGGIISCNSIKYCSKILLRSTSGLSKSSWTVI